MKQIQPFTISIPDDEFFLPIIERLNYSLYKEILMLVKMNNSTIDLARGTFENIIV